MKLALIIIGGLILLAVVAVALFVFVIQDVETPDYEVLAQDGPFELRDYPPLIVAEATHPGSRRGALRQGFGSLAGYIFARDRSGESIAMTAPVTQERPEKIAMTAPVTQSPTKPGAWTVRFVMPGKYDLSELPAPGSDRVRLERIPARRLATVRFSGSASDEILADKESALRAWMAEHGYEAAGSAAYAYYSDPFTPPFLRRYEVMIPVADG